MRLDKVQFQQTKEAILRAFGRDDLRKMLRLQLDEDLDRVAGDDDLDTVVFDLITWAEQNGRLGDLIAGALAAKPNNTALQQLAADYARWQQAVLNAEPAPPTPVPTPPTPAPSRSSAQGWLLGLVGIVVVVVLAIVMVTNGVIPWPATVTGTPPPKTDTGGSTDGNANSPATATPTSEPTRTPTPEPTDPPTAVNHRPVIVNQSHSPRTPTTASTLTLQGEANDADGNLANVRIVLDGTDIALCNDPATPCAAVVDLAGYATGAHTYQIIACDYDGLCSNNRSVTFQLEPAPLRIYDAEWGGGSMEIAISDNGGTTTCLDIELWLSTGDTFRNGRTLFMYTKEADGSYTPLPRPHEYVVLLENDSWFTPKLAIRIADLQANCPYIAVPTE